MASCCRPPLTGPPILPSLRPPRIRPRWWRRISEKRPSSPPDTLAAKTQPDGSPLPEWAHYPAGVAWALGEAGLSTPAMQAAFSSDIPRGSGLSSSASIEMAFGVAWSRLGGWSLPPMQLALLGQKAENRYVGVNCGIMDQFASACGEADRLMLLDCRSLEYRSSAAARKHGHRGGGYHRAAEINLGRV